MFGLCCLLQVVCDVTRAAMSVFCLCSKARTYHCKVVLLDDQELIQEIKVSFSSTERQDHQHIGDSISSIESA